MTALVIVEGVVILVLALLVAGLLRSHADILKALHQLGVDLEHDHDEPSFRVREGVQEPGNVVGTPVHDISGMTLDGGAIGMRLAGGDHSTLLAFMSSGCSSCRLLWGSVGLDVPERHRVVIVTHGPEDESITALKELATDEHPIIMSSKAWDDYGVPGSPYFVLVDGQRGVVGEGSANDWRQIAKLLEDSSGDARHARRATGGVRETRADSELAAAGIQPGDPSLYPDTDESEEK